MRTKWLLGLALVTAVVAAYLPALQAGFVWNDDTYLTENRTLDGIEGLRLIWTEPNANEQYYPMVFTSFWVEKHLWSLQPFGYHLVNVLVRPAPLGRRVRRLDHRAQEHALALPFSPRDPRVVFVSRGAHESRRTEEEKARGAGGRAVVAVADGLLCPRLRLSHPRPLREDDGLRRPRRAPRSRLVE